jgi:hypothetical protein
MEGVDDFVSQYSTRQRSSGQLGGKSRKSYEEENDLESHLDFVLSLVKCVFLQ